MNLHVKHAKNKNNVCKFLIAGNDLKLVCYFYIIMDALFFPMYNKFHEN